MRNLPTHFFITSGIILILAWFFYATIFAGIPYQDPTPKMSARYVFHSKISNIILALGLVSLLIGVVGGASKFLLKKLGKGTSHMND